MRSRDRMNGIAQRCRSTFLCLLTLAAINPHGLLLAQNAQAPGLKTPPPASNNTPRQVMDATAKFVQPYEPSSKLRLAISIKAPKMAEEEALLKQLQDRDSPNFKKYLSPEQWNARFAPSAQDEQAVVDWATSHGLTVTARYANRLMVNVEGTVDAIEKAFDISINRYAVNGTTEFSNDRDPAIPGNLTNIVQYVDGLNSIQRMRPANASLHGVRGLDYTPGPLHQIGPSGGASAKAAPKASAKDKGVQGTGSQITNGFYDPSDLWSSNMYDYNALMAQGHCCNPTGNSGGTPPQTSIGLATDGDFADSDMYSFAGQYNLASHWYRIFVDGTPGGGDDETTLDIEWATATSNSRGSEYATSSVYVYEAAQGFGDFGTLYQQMLNDNVVNVVNISYGLPEYDFSSSLVNSWHSLFNQMVGQGWTIMAASGDQGASTGCSDAIQTIYPGSDPDIVAVGGTQLETYSDGTFYSEVTWTGDTYAGACGRNDGGTGGGCSSLFAAPGYQSSPACGSGSRSVPDVALNASPHSAQNYFFNGSLQGVAGTSIASPMMSGFVAQENAYLLAIGLGGAPVGELNYKIYYLAQHGGNSYEAHYPFYDVTQGCNSNDITNEYGLGSYCAGTGYDLTTGWGSFNALQLAWAINTYDLGDFGAPTVTFSGPNPSNSNGSYNYYNTDQTVSWTVTDTGGGYTPTGVAGFSQAWDSAISDPTAEATPGSGNSFYSGPEFPNATSGYLKLSWAGQGCHYATVDAWDNSGITSGNQYYYYLCYDTIAPVVVASNSPAANSAGYEKSSVKVALSASDPGTGASGVKSTYYSINNTSCTSSNLGNCAVYSGPITISATGTSYVAYFTKDEAGNVSGESYDYVYIDEVAPVTAASLSGTGSGSTYSTAVKVTLSATDNYSGVASTTYSLDGGSNTTYSGALTVSTPGAHTVKFFSVDRAGNTESTKSASFTIVSPTKLTLTSSLNPATNGASVTLTATVTASVSGTPAGTITFKNGSTTLGTASLSNGKATYTTTSLPVGSDALTASYGGETYDSASSGSLTETVHETTKTTVASSLNPSSYNQSVTFTATVASSISGTPSGSVQFLDGSTSLGTETLSSGKATLALTTLSAGTHSITAKYLGSSTYNASASSALSQTVKQVSTKTTLSSSENPASYGQAVTFTATVTPSIAGTATGTVTFKSGSTTLASVALSSGKATYTSSTLAVGTASVTAVYGGSTDYTTSTSAAVSETVKQATTKVTVVSSLNPSTYGQTVTFTATVVSSTGATPTGTVEFKDGTVNGGSVTLSGGKATFTTNVLPAGANSITAAYGGNIDFAAGTSSALVQTVKASPTTTTLTSSLNPATYGKTVTFTATVKATTGPTPTGSVTFESAGVKVSASLNSSGVATFSTNLLPKGSNSVTAIYAATTNDATSTSAVLKEQVN